MLEVGRNKLKEEFNKIAESDKDSERVEKLRKILNKNLELLEETSSFETIDSYLPYFTKENRKSF